MISNFTELLQTAMTEHHYFLLYPLLFMAGVITSLNPCNFPVITLTIGYIGSLSHKSWMKAIIMTLVIVLTRSLVFAGVSVIFLMVSFPIDYLMTEGWFLFAVSFIFITMGLVLLGAIRLPLPHISFSSSFLKGSEIYQALGASLVGSLSAILTSPCLLPIYIVIVSTIAVMIHQAKGMSFMLTIVHGSLMLFVFALGQSILIALGGIFAGLLPRLPRSGKWLSVMQKIFAYIFIILGCLFLIYIGQHTDFPDISIVLF